MASSSRGVSSSTSLLPTRFTSYSSNNPSIMAPAAVKVATLEASYTTPGTSHTFSHPLPTRPSSASTKEKTSYLSALRSSVVKLQDEVNAFLTTKMEEDKALATNTVAKIDESKEEENYGEEVVEED